MRIDPDYNHEFNPSMRAEMQQLYRVDDRSLWKESVPDKTATDVEDGPYAQECALIVRRSPHPITNKVSLHSITVQSPLIKEVLAGTFKGFKGINTQLKQQTFDAPFHPFYLLSMASVGDDLQGRVEPENQGPARLLVSYPKRGNHAAHY